MFKETKNNKKNGKMTLDKLALMVGKGFNEVYERMDKNFSEVYEYMDKRFDFVEQRLDRLENRVESILEVKAGIVQ